MVPVRRVLAFLEDRRVLFAPWNVEIPEDCVESILLIRQFLTDQLGQLDDRDEVIASHLRAMRAACREFLRVADELRLRGDLRPWVSGTAGWVFNDALGELRAIFGVHVVQLAAKFGIDIEDDLASILPALTNDDDQRDDWPRARPRRARAL